MSWGNIFNMFPARPRGAEATEYLTKAYRDVFSGSASKTQAEAVLTDLAYYSNFYTTAPPASDLATYAEWNGMRMVFGRVFRFLKMSDAEIRRLEEAARQETLVSRSDNVENIGGI